MNFGPPPRGIDVYSDNSQGVSGLFVSKNCENIVICDELSRFLTCFLFIFVHFLVNSKEIEANYFINCSFDFS